MSSRMAVFFAAALLAAPLSTQAGAAPAASSSRQPLRIAYVDLDEVAAKSKAVQAKIGQVEADLKSKQKAYAEKTKTLRALRARLSQQESVMSATQIEQTKAQISKLEDDCKYLEFEYGKALDNTSRNLIEPVLDDVLSAVQRVAKQHQIDLVLRGDLVLFSSDRVNITSTIIQELDRTTAAAGSPRGATGAAGKK